VTYTNEYMDSLRRAGDEFADSTVDALFAHGDVGRFNTIMRWFSTSGQDLPDGVPAEAREYLEATRMPPAWVDWDVIEVARQFFADNNVHISTALAFAAMPAGYATPHIAKLLSTTHSLEYPARRMAETGQFTVYMMQPDAFESGGRFIPSLQKVRLLHASIRHHLHREGRWDEAELGVPICQEDMIGSLMGFSIHVLDALHRLGIRMTVAQAEAYYYAWRITGIMLGCDPAAVPADTTSAREFFDAYMLRHMGPSPEGARLTHQLIELYQEVIPGKTLDPAVPAVIRYLVGDTVADWLEVPRSHWDTAVNLVPVVLGIWEAIENSGPAGRWVIERVGRVTTNLELSALTGGRVMHYAIPEQLKDDYAVKRLDAATARWTPPQ
jgi:ER-bound oxygenase mpaB/B'/Rubber oxygenase, catalytic domain